MGKISVNTTRTDPSSILRATRRVGGLSFEGAAVSVVGVLRARAETA